MLAKFIFISLLNLVFPLSSLVGTNFSTPKLSQHEVVRTYENISGVINKGTTYYVAPDVDKTHRGSGLSKEDPESIYLLEDANKLQPGDTVILTGKEYVFNDIRSRIFTSVSGEFNKYITIKSETEENVVLDFSAAMFDSTLRGVSLNGSYIYWKGVDIKGAGDNGMYVGGNFNIIEGSSFYNNRDSGFQLGRADGSYATISEWPSHNYIKNCTSFNNYDNETYGENADGFAAKLTIGYGNIFDGCIAYRNSDDGWDLYAKTDSGNIGDVIIYNCIAFENGFIAENQDTCNKNFPTFKKELFKETDNNGNEKGYSYTTRDGDGNGFKLGGSIMEGNTFIYNSLAFHNKMHGITDNSNPGVIYAKNCTSMDNGAVIDDNKNSKTYGQVYSGTSDQEVSEECANIDLSRQTYSYNIVENCISLKSNWNTSIGKDALRGSIKNSILGTEFGNVNSYDYFEAMDCDTKQGVISESICKYSPSDIFYETPILEKDGTLKYQLSGLKNYTIDKQFRNVDGSINIKDFFKFKEGSKLQSRQIGCDLSKSKYSEYEHFNLLDYSSFSSENDLVLAATKQSIFLPVNTSCVYQDFTMPISIGGVSIKYSSDNTNVLSIGELGDFSASGIRKYNIEVKRDLFDVFDANLILTFTYKGLETNEKYKVSVMPGNPSIGEIYSDDISNNRVIIDAFSDYELPEISVTNGNDYNGKLIDKNKYNLERKYFYASDKNSTFYEVKGFTTSKPGVFKIYNFVSLLNSNIKKLYCFEVFVVSTSSNIDFENQLSTVQVNKNGFVISGNLTSAAGKLFVYSSDTKLTNPDTNLLLKDGKSRTFRNDSISFSYTHNNDKEYYVYYLVSNLSGSYVSQVYESKIEVIEINSESKFNSIFSGSTKTNVIYTLTKDLDFSSIECTPAKSKASFNGLFNGLGHSISNVKINRTGDGQAAIWYKVENGTIENVKFNNINLDCGASNKQVGIVATSYGGNFYNIAINNVSAHGKERVAGLIGQAFEGGDTTIEKVSLINDEKQSIVAESKDAGGIIGLCQTTSSPTMNYKVDIKNVLVSAKLEASTYCGGVIGRFDDQKPIIYALKVNKCVVHGSVKTSGNYCGGVIGGQVSSTRSEIYNCISMMDLYHKGSVNKLTISEKNCSPIMGRHPGTMIVLYCAGLIAEYESGFDVEVYSMDKIKDINQVTNVTLDESWSNNVNKAPYYFINFEG